MFFNRYKKKNKKQSEAWKQIKDESFDFDLIESYFNSKEQETVFQRINNKTIHDIDLHEIFMFIDRTSSRVGQQYLLDKLFTLKSPPAFETQETLIAYFNDNQDKRGSARQRLSHLNKHEAYYISDLFSTQYVQKPKWYRIIPFLSVLSIAALVLTFFMYEMIFLLVGLLIINLVVHYWNKRNIFVYMDSIPQLLVLYETVRALIQSGIPVTPEEASVQSSLKSIGSLKKRLSVFKLEAKNNASEMAGLALLIVEYIKILFLIEPQIVFGTLKKLEEKQHDIRVLFEYVGEVDTAISIASLRATVSHWCKPVFINKNKHLNVQNIYHPLIFNAVSNTIDMKEKSVLLTGSNMSGKTTFIRTIAVNTLLAQTINTAFADKFELSPMRIFSAIRISDDLLNDKSYYMEEVDTIKTMIDESRSGYPNIFFLDEIFKGTNTTERIAAGKAVLSYLSDENNLIFVSTHDLEIATLLSETYALYHFTETVDDNAIHFDYKLKPGRLTTRNAIKILELNNYPLQITNEANTISGTLKSFS